MDRDTAVARIKRTLGFRTDLTAEIQNALQDEQDILEAGATLPFFLVQEDQTFPIIPSVPASAVPQEYTLPTGFLRDIDEQDGTLRYQKSAPGPQVFLEKLDYTNAEKRFYGKTVANYNWGVVIIPSEDTQFSPGTPIAYVVRKATVRIYPGPDQNYNLLWSFYKKDGRLDGANVTNQWLTYAPQLLIGRAGKRIAADARDQDAVAAFSEMLDGSPQVGRNGAEKDYLALLYERELGGRTYAMGARL